MYKHTHTQMLASTPMKYREDIIAQFLFYERKMQRKFKDQLGHTLFLAFVRTQKINYLSSSSCVLSGNSINIFFDGFFPKEQIKFYDTRSISFRIYTKQIVFFFFLLIAGKIYSFFDFEIKKKYQKDVYTLLISRDILSQMTKSH